MQNYGDSELIRSKIEDGFFISASDAPKERFDGLVLGEEKRCFTHALQQWPICIEVSVLYSSLDRLKARTSVRWLGHKPWIDQATPYEIFWFPLLTPVQIRTLDWREPSDKITRCKLATGAAKRLEKFLRVRSPPNAAIPRIF